MSEANNEKPLVAPATTTAPAPFTRVPHDREVVIACIELWKADPKTELLSMAKFHPLIKANHPDWSISVGRVKSCLKAANLLPLTADQKLQQQRDQQYASQIRSKEMPGLDLASITSTSISKLNKTKNKDEKPMPKSKSKSKAKSKQNQNQDDQLIKVVTSKARGKGFHAVRDIQNGTVLWEEQPLIMVTPFELLKVARIGLACPFCAKPCQTKSGALSTGTITCSQYPACVARYCDASCRAKDEGIHASMWHSEQSKEEEGILKTASSRAGNLLNVKRDIWARFENYCMENSWMGAYGYGIVLLTRLSLEAKAAAAAAAAGSTSTADTVEKASLFKLQYESLATVGHDIRFHTANKGSLQNASVFGAEQVEVMWHNAHDLLALAVSPVYDLSYTEFMNGVGAFNLNNVDESIYRMQSHLNHSCEPNVHARFGAERHYGLKIVTVADIKANEELRISYVDPSLSLENRQDQLRKNWGFICACPRCKREQKELELMALARA